MKITPQDIIDKEFRVKFRGFDMAEVDVFLEEVAENLFRLSEENTLLNEQVTALRQDLEAAAGRGGAPRGLDEFPGELADILEDLRQDSATMRAELVALKQDRQSFDAFREKLEKTVASVRETAALITSRPPDELPAGLAVSLEGFKLNTEAVAAELAALKEERRAFDALRKNFEEVARAAQKQVSSMTPQQGQAPIPAGLGETLDDLKLNTEAVAAELAALKEERRAFDALRKNFEEVARAAQKQVSSMTPQQGQAPIPAGLGETLDDLKLKTAAIGAELAALKEEVGAFSGISVQIKDDLQKQLSAHFAGLEAKLSGLSSMSAPAALKTKDSPPVPGKKEKLAVAEIIHEPESQDEDTRLPDYQKDADASSGDGSLEFLSEDDILDVDKLRGIFQSVLDENIRDGHENREGDDDSADLLFLEDDFIDDDHEPEVTFSLDENDSEKKQNYHKPKPV